MHIGPVEDDYFDSQEEDFYYDDYNSDDQEEPKVWEDGDEVHMQIPPELLHAPNCKGKKRMHMQRRPCNRSDAEISASIASLFAFAPPSPIEHSKITFSIKQLRPWCTQRLQHAHIT
jgi:hypothetical protein